MGSYVRLYLYILFCRAAFKLIWQMFFVEDKV